MLGKRGFPLERAAKQVCREAGARVSTNVFVRDMDLAEHQAILAQVAILFKRCIARACYRRFGVVCCP